MVRERAKGREKEDPHFVLARASSRRSSPTFVVLDQARGRKQVPGSPLWKCF